jgi:hypothetical protein
MRTNNKLNIFSGKNLRNIPTLQQFSCFRFIFLNHLVKCQTFGNTLFGLKYPFYFSLQLQHSPSPNAEDKNGGAIPLLPQTLCRRA